MNLGFLKEGPELGEAVPVMGLCSVAAVTNAPAELVSSCRPWQRVTPGQVPGFKVL